MRFDSPVGVRHRTLARCRSGLEAPRRAAAPWLLFPMPSDTLSCAAQIALRAKRSSLVGAPERPRDFPNGTISSVSTRRSPSAPRIARSFQTTSTTRIGSDFCFEPSGVCWAGTILQIAAEFATVVRPDRRTVAAGDPAAREIAQMQQRRGEWCNSIDPRLCLRAARASVLRRTRLFWLAVFAETTRGDAEMCGVRLSGVGDSFIPSTKECQMSEFESPQPRDAESEAGDRPAKVSLTARLLGGACQV